MARKPQPSQWLIATDGSASPSSVEQPASAGWGFVVDRVGCLSGVEVECWGERADRLVERGRSGEPCFVLQRWVYTIGVDEPELSVERCRWCRRIFSASGSATIHEARCRHKVGEKPAFECRKCGMRLPRHFGRAKRMAHEQYCLGSAVANLTCRNCGELFVHMQARRLHEVLREH